MSLTHTTAVRNSIADGVVDQVDLGSADAAGDIQIAADSGFTQILCVVPLNNPAFAGAAGGAANLSVSPAVQGIAIAAGTAAFFRLRSRDNTEIFRGTVGVSSADMIISNTTIAIDDAIGIESGSYTAAT